MNITLRNGSTVTLTPEEIMALRQITREQVSEGTLTSVAIDQATRRILNKLAQRGIVDVGTADEGDARRKCYSISDWRVADAVSEAQS